MPGLEIIFDTVKSSRKYPNLIARPSCFFVLGWAGEQTVQYEGEAVEPSGPELKRCQDIYFQTWRDGPSRLSWPGIAYFIMNPPQPLLIYLYVSKQALCRESRKLLLVFIAR
jgi:hypothetical protein